MQIEFNFINMVFTYKTIWNTEMQIHFNFSCMVFTIKQTKIWCCKLDITWFIRHLLINKPYNIIAETAFTWFLLLVIITVIITAN